MVHLRLAPAILAASLVIAGCAQQPATGGFSTFTSTTTAAPVAPPVARVEPVTDEHFGVSFTDPYRWMENTESKDFQRWMRGQDAYTRAALKRIPGRAALLDRIGQLSEAGTVVWNVTQRGDRYIYQKQGPGDDNYKLYARDGVSGAERLLVDPTAMTRDGVHYTLDWYYPSLDGSHIAYGISAGGSEASVLHVVDAATGRVLADAIDRCQFGAVAWLPDGSFFYNRLQLLPAGAPVTDKYSKTRIYRHRPGANPNGDGDEIVFGFDVSPKVPVDANEIAYLVYSPASPYLVGVVQKFVKNEVSLYAVPLNQLAGAATPWRRVVDESAQVTGFDVHGKDIYLMTHDKAPRFKVMRTRMDSPSFKSATTVIARSDLVVTGIAAASDALYVQQIDGGLARLKRVPFSGGNLKAVPVKLPYEGSISEISVDPQRPGALLKLTSWTEPQLWFAYDPKAKTLTDTGLRPRSPVDYSAIMAEEVKAESHDGTLVPLSIIRRRDLPLDGRNPTLVVGYGAYGTRQDPGFSPTLLAWVERGGILAVAHVRGGGEYGEDWHKAGQKATKPNTWKDFIACGEYLVARNYTQPALLAGQGGSAGGITVGRAMTSRPDLFAAIISNVGVADGLRWEFSANGPPNIPEFGTVTTEEGFKALYEMGSYQHVQDGEDYPAVLLTTGINDPRVDSWEVAKMTARLQAASSSGKPILMRVDFDAGHGLGSTKAQNNEEQADEWSFLLWQFGDPAFQPVATK